MRRFLVVTADDFGYDDDRNRGIVECFRDGGVTRASLLVNGYASDKAALLAASFDIPLGLHLNLTEGIPVSKPAEIRSLLTENGQLLGKFRFREALQRQEVCLQEVKHEIKAQISKYKELMNGKLPRHVDGHQHVHVLPGISKTLAEILSQQGIKSVRLPAELDLEECTWLPENSVNFYKSVSTQSLEAGPCFAFHGIEYPDRFLGMSCMGKYMTIDRLQEKILKCFQQQTIKETIVPAVNGNVRPTQVTCELMVHPGYHCTDAEKGGCGAGADEFSMSVEREHEMHVLCSKDMRDFYKKFDIQLCG